MAFIVGDRYRTNELSLVPGGYTVVVEYFDRIACEYTRIKRPAAYIRKLSKHTNVKNAYVKP